MWVRIRNSWKKTQWLAEQYGSYLISLRKSILLSIKKKLLKFLGICFFLLRKWRDSFASGYQNGRFIMGKFRAQGFYTKSIQKSSVKGNSIWIIQKDKFMSENSMWISNTYSSSDKPKLSNELFFFYNSSQSTSPTLSTINKYGNTPNNYISEVKILIGRKSFLVCLGYGYWGQWFLLIMIWTISEKSTLIYSLGIMLEFWPMDWEKE